MPKAKLTDAAIQRFQAPPGGRVEYFDVTLPGFGMRVAGPTPRNPGGRRSWVLFYRFQGEQKRLTIEPAYPALSLADARKKAGAALQMVALGKDPGEEKAQAKAFKARSPDTITSVSEEFIRRHMEGKKRAASYVENTRRLFRNHVLPRWAEREIQTITRRDVIELLDAIVDGGSDVRDADGTKRHLAGGSIAANRTLAAIRVLFNWAMRRGIVDANPCAPVERPGEETKRERTLSTEEVQALWPRFESLGYPFGPFFKVALLTAQRRSEVAGMRWADINMIERTWTMPAELTKASRGHLVPLAPAVLEILAAVPRMAGSPYVFTTAGNTPISGFSRAKSRLDEGVAGIKQWGIHDLRRTAATEMSRLGVARFIVSKVLNHSDRTITGVYDRHEYTAEKRHALETWAAYLTELVAPVGANVVAIRGAAA